MQKIWLGAGRVLFWLAWPVSWLTLRNSQRTRVLIVCGEEAVMLKNWIGTGGWSLPGGGRKRGETALIAAQREVHEEVGLSIGTDQFHLVGSYRRSKQGLSFMYELFIVHLPQKLPLRPRPLEISEACWMKRSDVQAKAAGASVQEALRHWPV